MQGNDWKEKGQRVVGAAADLATGLFRGMQNIGPRIQAAQYKPIVEAFCAYTGLMAAQHGRLQRTEIDGVRHFLFQNRQHPVFGGFPLDELLEKFKNYAVRAFLDETEIFQTVLNPIPKGSEEAHLIVAGCMSVIFADGRCDASERTQLEQLALRLGVDTGLMARNMGVTLPTTTATPPAPVSAPPAQGGSPFARSFAAPPPSFQPQPVALAPSPPVVVAAAPVPPPAPAAAGGGTPCSMCQGKGCVFCNQTGFKA